MSETGTPSIKRLRAGIGLPVAWWPCCAVPEGRAMTAPTPRTDAVPTEGDRIKRLRQWACQALLRQPGASIIERTVAEDLQYLEAKHERDLAAAQDAIDRKVSEYSLAMANLGQQLKEAQEARQAAEALAAQNAKDAERYRKARANGGFFFSSDRMTDGEIDARIDELPDYAADISSGELAAAIAGEPK